MPLAGLLSTANVNAGITGLAVDLGLSWLAVRASAPRQPAPVAEDVHR